MHRSIKSRRGITAVLAMMYLGLFSVLALGFFASVSTSGQIAGNDMRSVSARLAAESGMQFIKYHLDDMDIPKETRPAQILSATFNALAARLNNEPCMNGATVGVNAAGTKVLVPGPDNAYIPVDGSGAEFRVEIERYGQWGLRVRSVGRANPTATVTSNVRGGRGVQLDYENKQKDLSIFGYGMAARGPVTLDGNSRIVGVGNSALGNMLIDSTVTPTLVMKSNATISGTVSFTHAGRDVDMYTLTNTIAGSNNLSLDLASKIPTLPNPVEFPAIDTDPYKPFAGNATYGGSTITPPNSSGTTQFSSMTHRNVLIKASPHADRWVVFDNATIDGVVYIETPNKVRFDGNTVIRGVIVVQNDPTHDSTRNLMVLNGNTQLKPLSTLTALNSANFPPALTDLSGPSILAPAFSVSLNSNFGATGGSIIADKVAFDSNASGSLHGSVITLSNAPVMMNSGGAINILSHSTGGIPGTRLTSSYKPLPTTYKEFRP